MVDSTQAQHSKQPSSHPSGPRIAGVLVPLFSVHTARSCGIGDIGDLPALGRFAKSHGQSLIALLPLCELPEGETSPYSSSTSFAMDPMYIAIDQLEDVRREDQQALLGPDQDALLTRLRASRTVEYGAVRAYKRRVLRAAFERFWVREWQTRSTRYDAFKAFLDNERFWLADYSLFRACKQRFGESWWLGWPTRLRERHPDAVAEAHAELEHEALYHAYVQWIARQQWLSARAEVNAMGVELMGDLPFMVGLDSADVWGHQPDFFLNATLGVPGDDLAPEGQDWGLPAYNWPAMDNSSLAWVQRRASSMATLFDRFRVDHLVGYYRMFVRPKGETPRWMPSEEPVQIARGERVLAVMVEAAKRAGGKIVAEDLGTIPDFVRTSLRRLAIPGYRVMMWEKEGNIFRDPASYPYLSLVTSSTHDTITLAEWWETLAYDERRRALEGIPSLRAVAKLPDVDQLTPVVHAALITALYGAGSELALLPIQDLYGSKERVNTPGTTGAHNWTWRLPHRLEDMDQAPGIGARLATSTQLAKKLR